MFYFSLSKCSKWLSNSVILERSFDAWMDISLIASDCPSECYSGLVKSRGPVSKGFVARGGL
jgi:hypothetical protein